jgi:spermidine synthase
MRHSSPLASALTPPATISELDGVRYLHLGTPWVQGAMRIARPQRIELEYVQRMLASMLWRPTEALGLGHALQLGLGAGAITRFTLQALGLPTTAVEINPQVLLACHTWFRLPRNGPLLQVHVEDAGAWLASPPAQGLAREVTLMHVDLYDQDAAAPVLDDEAFYERCWQMLADGGVMAVNLFGRHASFERSVRRIADAFGADQVWSLRPTREGNTVVVAGRAVQVPDRDELVLRAHELESRFAKQGLPASKWLRMVRPYQPVLPSVD